MGGGHCGRDEHRKKGKGPLSNCLRHFNPHRRALVDHHDAVGIAQVHDLLSVGVVAGAEGVRPQPVQQVEVLHDQGPVEAFATDLGGGERHHSPLHRQAGASPHASAANHRVPLPPGRSQPRAPFLADRTACRSAPFTFLRGTATRRGSGEAEGMAAAACRAGEPPSPFLPPSRRCWP